MIDPWAERLSDFLDGELNDSKAAELEQHLGECVSCRQSLSQLRAVIARLGGDPLQPSDQPSHRGWNRIEASIRAPRRRWVLPAVIAASLAGLAILAGLWRPQPSDRSSPAQLLTLAADYRQAAADLETVLKLQRSRLRPETVRAVETSLATIDSAIAQASRALAADPANEFITRYLAQLRDTRLAALRDAVTLAQRGS